MLREEPSFTTPYVEKAEPTRQNVRRDMDEPKLTQSSVDSDEPSFDTPNTERPLPSRTKDRKDIDEPSPT
jgi:hypothetical protein